MLQAIDDLAFEVVATAIYQKQEADLQPLEERLRSEVSDDAWQVYQQIKEWQTDQATQVFKMLVRLVAAITTTIERETAKLEAD